MVAKLRSYVVEHHIGLLALFVALGGSAYAAARDSAGTPLPAKGAAHASLPPDSVGTPQLKRSAVTSAKVKNGSLLYRDFAPGQVPLGDPGPQGERGPRGERGPEGDHGPEGDPVTRRFAVVKADGTLVASSGVTSVSDAGSGLYDVTFKGDVSGCAASTSPGALNGAYAGNRITSAGRGASPTEIRVRTQRLGSGDFVSEDADFNVAVFC